MYINIWSADLQFMDTRHGYSRPTGAEILLHMSTVQQNQTSKFYYYSPAYQKSDYRHAKENPDFHSTMHSTMKVRILRCMSVRSAKFYSMSN